LNPGATHDLLHWVCNSVVCFCVLGLRFELAHAFGRRSHGFDPNAAFFTALDRKSVV
jgi:hypothetical protein